MKYRPMLMSAPMVRAILDGRKTQTRRIVKPAPEKIGEGYMLPLRPTCPYGWVTDRLYVREAWRPEELGEQPRDELGDLESDFLSGTDGIRYRADDQFLPIENNQEASERWHELLRPDETWPKLRPTRWRPSIHMPKWAARIWLEITAVRLERLQDISRGDCMEEGCPFPNMAAGPDPREWYSTLWDLLNEKRGYGWDVNPFAWVIEFRRVTGG